jgi:acyl-homoserine lactone acylase PvdQ
MRMFSCDTYTLKRKYIMNFFIPFIVTLLVSGLSMPAFATRDKPKSQPLPPPSQNFSNSQSFRGDSDRLISHTHHLKGLKNPAEILVDAWGIPHIYAMSEEDVFFVQGFNAARDRLFQMDVWRRRGLGKLAEVFGPSYIEQDKASRLFLYRGDMRQEWDAYGPRSEQIRPLL